MGPALGGMVIAEADSGTAFLLNAVSFFGVILVLYHWKRPAPERIETGALCGCHAGRHSLCAAIAAGAVGADPHRRIQRGSDRLAGVAADSGATVRRDRVRRAAGMFWRGSAGGGDHLAATAAAAFGGWTGGSGHRRVCRHDVRGRAHLILWRLCAVLATAGAAWIGILACLNTAAQTMCPSWVRARALSMYLLVLQGGMAIGSTMWGALATRVGLPNALLCSALALVGGIGHHPKTSVERAASRPWRLRW